MDPFDLIVLINKLSRFTDIANLNVVLRMYFFFLDEDNQRKYFKTTTRRKICNELLKCLVRPPKTKLSIPQYLIQVKKYEQRTLYLVLRIMNKVTQRIKNAYYNE